MNFVLYDGGSNSWWSPKWVIGHEQSGNLWLNVFKKRRVSFEKIFSSIKSKNNSQEAEEEETTSGRTPVTWSAVNRYPQSADVTRVVFSREHRLRGRWGQKSRCIYKKCAYLRVFDDNISSRRKENAQHNDCLHTCKEHTLAQSTLLQPYISDIGALTYANTLQKPTNQKPCRNTYKSYMPTTHTYPTSTQHYIPTLPLHTCTTITTTLLYNHYNTTRPIIYATQWLCPCTHAEWACGWPGKRPFASDRILCAATSIGDHIMFEKFRASWRRKEYWIPPKTDCTTIGSGLLQAELALELDRGKPFSNGMIQLLLRTEKGAQKTHGPN